jgi:hypothetical protein
MASPISTEGRRDLGSMRDVDGSYGKRREQAAVEQAGGEQVEGEQVEGEQVEDENVVGMML